LAEFNEKLRAYIYQHNNTVHSSTKVTPLERFLTTKKHILSLNLRSGWTNASTTES
jgi:hypothetical protein